MRLHSDLLPGRVPAREQVRVKNCAPERSERSLQVASCQKMRLALASSPDDTRRSALERAEAEPSATGDDDESDPEWDAAAANYDESVRRGLVAPPPKRPKHERVIGQRPRDEPALVSALKRCYALDAPGASAAYPHASHAEIVRLLRRCEQFEIALQGDDYSDLSLIHI